MSYELFQRGAQIQNQSCIAFYFKPEAHREDEVFCADFPRLYAEEKAWIEIGSLEKAEPNEVRFFIEKYSDIPVIISIDPLQAIYLNRIVSGDFEVVFNSDENPFGNELKINIQSLYAAHTAAGQ